MATKLSRSWVEIEQEDDGRWIGAVPSISGCHVYGKTKEDAIRKVEVLALKLVADRIKHGEPLPAFAQSFLANAVAA